MTDFVLVWNPQILSQAYFIGGHLGVLALAEEVVAVLVEQPERGLGVLYDQRVAEFRVGERQELVDVQLLWVRSRSLAPPGLRRRNLFLRDGEITFLMIL